MRILFLENHPMWVHGLPNGFRQLGHQVKTYFPDANTKRTIDLFRPHLVIVMGWTPANATAEKQLRISKAVRKSGVPLVYWATEDPGYHRKFSRPLVRRIKPDFVFTIHRPTLKEYRKMRIPAAHLDFGYDPCIHKRVAAIKKYRSTAALVANGYIQLYRQKPGHFRFKSLRTLVNPFLANGLDVALYGRYWNKMRGFFRTRLPQESIRGCIPYPKANKVYSSVKFVICPQNAGDRLTQRTYEILASGGLIVTNDTPEIRRWFRPGRDLLVTSSEKMTRSLIRKYARQPGDCERIRRNAVRAAAPHAYVHRAQYILRVLRKRGILQRGRGGTGLRNGRGAGPQEGWIR
ncbi:spore protein YkvP [Paenibacillus elgii]|nr:spore protein YkvP [Paenibacillus elgii]